MCAAGVIALIVISLFDAMIEQVRESSLVVVAVSDTGGTP